MKIATAKTKTSKHWRTEEISWPQFLHRILRSLQDPRDRPGI